MGSVKFSISLLFFWIKGKVEVDKRFVKTNIANTILGIIPVGKDQQNIPLKNISGAMLSSKYYFKPMLFGLILLLFGLGSFGGNFFLGLVLTLLGIGIAGNGIQTLLVIEKSGSPYIISVPFFEKSKMASISNNIHQALADDVDKTDLNMFFDKKADKNANANMS